MKVWACRSTENHLHIATDMDIAYMWLRRQRANAAALKAHSVPDIFPGIKQVRVAWWADDGQETDPVSAQERVTTYWIEQVPVLSTRGQMEVLL